MSTVDPAWKSSPPGEDLHVLVVDDDAALGDLLRRGLSRAGFPCLWRASAVTALEDVRAGRAAVVVTDVRMAGMDGLELCRTIVKEAPEVPVLVMSAFGGYETLELASEAGAYEFLAKPVDLDLLALAVRRALERRALRAEVARLRAALDGRRGP